MFLQVPELAWVSANATHQCIFFSFLSTFFYFVLPILIGLLTGNHLTNCWKVWNFNAVYKLASFGFFLLFCFSIYPSIRFFLLLFFSFVLNFNSSFKYSFFSFLFAFFSNLFFFLSILRYFLLFCLWSFFSFHKFDAIFIVGFCHFFSFLSFFLSGLVLSLIFHWRWLLYS